MKRVRRVIGGAAGAAVAAVAVAVSQIGSAGAAALPVTWNYPLAFVLGTAFPDTPAPGAISVDWKDNKVPASCENSTHPVPVLLVHGTWENQNNNWQAIAPWLKNNGYCVYSLTYGQDITGTGGTQHVWVSAQQLGKAVDLVLQATGRPQLDLVGHSQGGGITPAWYIDYLMRNNNQPNGAADNPAPVTSGPSKVRNFIGISPSNHGTTLDGIATLAKGILGAVSLIEPAASDQTVGSKANTHLAAFGDTAPGVQYTTIIEKGDEVVTPYQNQLLSTTSVAAGSSVNNIIMQNAFTVNYHDDVTPSQSGPKSEAACILDADDHLASPYNSRIGRILVDTLGGTSTGAYLDPYCHLIIPAVGG